MSSTNMKSSCTYVSLVLLLLAASVHAQHASTAASNHHTPLRHGTLLLSSITLLNKPLAEGASSHLKPHHAAEVNTAWRCCLSVTAYTAAVQSGSSSAHSTAQQAPGPHASTAPTASFRTCSNTSSSSCMEALLQESANVDLTLYKVALLLPAQAGQPAGQQNPPAGASAVPAGSTSTAHGTSSSTDSSSHGQEDMLPGTNDTDSPAGSASMAEPPAAAAAQRSSLHDMLLTVHAEQEVAGQVYLVVATQLIRAGAGIVKVAVNMSHYAHTWTHPDALPAHDVAPPAAATLPPSSNASTQQDIPAPPAPATEPDTLSDQSPTVNSTAAAHHCPPRPTQDSTAATPPAQNDPATAGPAAPRGFPAFLPVAMQAELAGDPAALALYLQYVLGHGSTASAAAVPQDGAKAGVQTTVQTGGGSCAALPDEADSEAVTAWAAGLQAVLSTCPYDASLSAYLQAAAASVRHKYVLPAPAQHGQFLSDIAAVPAVAAALEVLLTSGFPVVSTATPEQLVLGMATAAAVVVLLLLLRICRTGNKVQRPANHAARQQQQQQQQQQAPVDVNRLQANPTAVQDACAFQQHDQLTLEEHLEGMDTDPFGYGPPPAAVPAQTAAAAAGCSSQPGSMLAAAQAVRRASVMAAGEAAGALKDAFMRRHTNQQGPSTGAGAVGFGGAAAAAAAAAERDWLNEDDEDRVNQAPETIQRQLQAGGRWQRDEEGRLVRGSWKAVRNSLAAAAQAVMAAVGSGGKAAAAAAGGGLGRAAGEGAGAVAVGGWAQGESDADAAALQQLLSAAPGAVVGFSGN